MSLPIQVLTSEASPQSTWRDWLGIIASVGCAIHCAAMPFVIAYLPSLGLSFLADEAFHKWMFVVCMGIGLAAFVPGWKLHRRLAPIGIATVGLTLVGTAAFGFAGECCTACELSSVAFDLESKTDRETPTTCACCENSSCVEGEGEGSTPVEVVTSTDVEINEQATAVVQASAFDTSLLAPYVPWITPIGGIILVAAHLLNRQYGGRCKCCSSSSEVV